ncbi:MAG: glycosyltransferase [Roseiarcus sp.]
MVDLSIVICTHNRYEIVGNAIASIEMQDFPRNACELILVDNSTDLVGQANFLADLDITCPHQIVIEPVPGLSRARNAGVKAAKGRIVSFLDDDARAPTNWAAETVAVMNRHKSAAVVGGPVRPIWPSPRPAWLHPWLEGFLTIVDRGEIERELPPHEWLAGTNIAFHRERLMAAGLFEERLGRIGKLLLSNEELTVTSNLRASGYTVVYNPAMEINHTVHADRISQKWMRQRIFWQVISDYFADNIGEVSLEASIDKILAYQGRLPLKQRGLPGLFLDVADPELFHAQTQALTEIIRLLGANASDWREYLRVKE